MTLANKFRPTTLNEIVGQDHLVGKYKILSSMVYKSKPFNIILYGPTSCGKTSIALALCNDLKLPYVLFNAAIDNKDALVEGINECIKNKKILIIDECHRLNKNIIDLLLPILEEQKITIFLMTTENIFFDFTCYS